MSLDQSPLRVALTCFVASLLLSIVALPAAALAGEVTTPHVATPNVVTPHAAATTADASPSAPAESPAPSAEDVPATVTEPSVESLSSQSPSLTSVRGGASSPAARAVPGQSLDGPNICIPQGGYHCPEHRSSPSPPKKRLVTDNSIWADCVGMKILMLWVWDGWVFESSSDDPRNRSPLPDEPDSLYLASRPIWVGRQSPVSSELKTQIQNVLNTWNKNCLTWVNP